MAALAYALLSFVLMVVPALATTHHVGGSSGWSPTTDLFGWASGKFFTVGDNLVFNYGPNHGVEVVTEEDYNTCNTGSPISSDSDGKTTVSLDKPGQLYFICPTPGHCQAGMKLSINVVTGEGSVPTIPALDPYGSQSPPISGFPSPIGGSNCPPFPPGEFPNNPIGGINSPPYGGWGQITFHGGANGKMNNGLLLWFSLVVAALVGVMVS